ncbi:hypothetical protein F8M41_019664 [Gigaspora margarita]|uniref:Transmembrane protein n=1 Tax=Gigaspora margarita TaxID=4874 RepID=A0A8H4AJP1_GIGMA|nr:hypothetical protein F8M41_019664 [Gigaspora margarita]
MLGSSKGFNHFSSSFMEYGDFGLCHFGVGALYVVILGFIALVPSLVMTSDFVVVGVLGLRHFVDVICGGFVSDFRLFDILISKSCFGLCRFGAVVGDFYSCRFGCFGVVVGGDFRLRRRWCSWTLPSHRCRLFFITRIGIV